MLSAFSDMVAVLDQRDPVDRAKLRDIIDQGVFWMVKHFNVDQRQRKRTLMQRGEGVFSVVCSVHVIPGFFENFRQPVHIIRIGFRDQDACYVELREKIDHVCIIDFYTNLVKIVNCCAV